MIAAMRT